MSNLRMIWCDQILLIIKESKRWITSTLVPLFLRVQSIASGGLIPNMELSHDGQKERWANEYSLHLFNS
jgi:hypothetical protein